MYLLTDGALVTSASDLTLASGCEFAFLRVLDHRLGWSSDPLPEDDAMLRRAAELGGAHEERMLERLRAEHGNALVAFPRPEGRDAATLRDAAEATRLALAAGAPVVYQGVFFDETDPALPFVGYADFLVRRPDGRYRVVDTKLSRHVRVTALLQLAAYHEQLQRLGIPVDDEVELVLGNERVETARVEDIAPVFRLRRARMHAIIAEHRAEGAPVRWGDPRYAVDGRCPHCEGPAAAADDLLTVAGMRLSQRARLVAAGIRTAGELAATPLRPAGCDIAEPSYAALNLQAALQRVAVGADPHAPPPVVVTDPRPIAALPAPSPGDIFFDFEGDPMHRAAGSAGQTWWGLDFLFGWVDADGRFDRLWAHSPQQERQALLDFLAMLRRRRAAHPDLHVYHYAAYEKTHLLSIAARHGVGEEEVDALLRDGVLVDLYPVVTSSLRIGVPSYSIKKLEPLYMGDEERAGVATGVDAVAQYVASCAAEDDGDHATARTLREEIAVYNAYDCRSTLRLRDWLRSLPEARALAAEAGQVPPLERPVFEPSPIDTGLQVLADRAEADGREDGAGRADAAAYRLAAAAIDFHRREAKSFWWEHFDRLEQPAWLWEDTRGVLVVESAEVAREWHREGRQRTDRRHLLLRGRWAPGSGAPRAGDVFLVYSEDPGGLPYRPPGHRAGLRVARQGRILDPERHDAWVPEGAVLIEESLPEGLAGQVEPWTALPGHLAPGPPPKADGLVAAIEEWGRTLLAAAPEWPRDAMSDLIRRVPLRLEPMRDADDGVRAVVASLTGMAAGTLAVQGPPGTGKTHLAAHVIRDLVADHGWRVGVTAQSHAVVEHVLDAVVLDAGLDPARVGKAAPSGKGRGYYDESPFTELIGPTAHAAFAAERAGGYVLGGTAWDLMNRRRVAAGQLDLLVVEEAGQFSLANTIAVAGSAARILLLGDPQQLPQVSQGTHPAPVDGSALGHLIGEASVLPAEHGYFLAESRRMDAAVAEPVSRLSYDGRLHAHASTRGRDLAGVAPGLHPVPVAHAGNATASPEEAAVVVDLARRHLELPWIAAAGAAPRPTSQDDVIVVTPYNAQVELIRGSLDAAGLHRVEVGTVDRFQGREAVIAIVSLAASSAAEVPRGIDFLLSRNRLNVSISRAKWAAYLVHSPGLLDHLPRTAEGLATLSRFIRLVSPGP